MKEVRETVEYAFYLNGWDEYPYPAGVVRGASTERQARKIVEHACPDPILGVMSFAKLTPSDRIVARSGVILRLKP